MDDFEEKYNVIVDEAARVVVNQLRPRIQELQRQNIAARAVIRRAKATIQHQRDEIAGLQAKLSEPQKSTEEAPVPAST